MIYKLIGSVLIILVCAGAGFRCASSYLREENSLRQLIYCLDYMKCELKYRLTPLSELCNKASKISTGLVSKVFLHFSEEVKHQISPHVECCMKSAIQKVPDMPIHINELFLMLGQTFGKFDLNGQVKGIDIVHQKCNYYLDTLLKSKDFRTKGYQTLGVCAGAALIILFI